MLEPILAWLEQVLQERFIHNLRIERMGASGLRLRVKDDPRAIDFPVRIDGFWRTGGTLPFTTWDASAAGWRAPLDSPLPAPGAPSLLAQAIRPVPSGYRVDYDILGLTYWMLSRREELKPDGLDLYERFPASASHAARHGYLERPVVDEWLDILGQVIVRTWPQQRLNAQGFSMRVSHDVDWPSRYAFGSPARLLRHMAVDVLKERAYVNALRAPSIWLNSRSRLHPNDPANTFEWIMDESDRHGLVSAFYFICGRTDPGKDAVYELEHPAIRGLLRRIHARGHEIGLHPSFNSFRSPTTVAAEAQRLMRVCADEGISQPTWGGRMHFLRWEHPTTMNACDAAGMAYDSTLTYADQAGFRCGTCFEYPAFDPVRLQSLRMRIRPLVAMEGTILSARYMGLGTGDAALRKFVKLKRACQAVRGCFTVLWHNSEFGSEDRRELYRAVLSS